MNPKRSIELLDQLTELGLTDRACGNLHHFRLAGRHATIQEHRRYCEKTESFQDDGENARVQQRLELIFRGYTAGGFRSGIESVFVSLADAAMAEIPPVHTAKEGN
jgi:hypothetical protein